MIFRATEIIAGQEPIVKTLDISWNSTDDTFTISAANIAIVYDLLGFVGPFVIKAKILLQEMWTRGYD